MILLYAVVPRESAPRDADLGRHDAGSVTVLYEETAEPPSGARSAVVEHGRKIVALADRVPLLPMRYGTTVVDTEELRTIARDRADDWSRRLADLAGRCELVVHLDLQVARPAAPVDSGRGYLEVRMACVRRRERALTDVRRVLEPWTTETRVLSDQRRLAVLVARADVDAVRHALATWSEGEPDLQLETSGPWPPFSFCEEGTS